jgi:hypothetical protein
MVKRMSPRVDLLKRGAWGKIRSQADMDFEGGFFLFIFYRNDVDLQMNVLDDNFTDHDYHC